MGFLEFKEVIELNDLVILYINFHTIYPVSVKETILSKKGVEVENIYQTKYGSLKAVDLVGKKYGTKVQLSRGYGYALHPTPELWTKCLPHRTQILYSTDISMDSVEFAEHRLGEMVTGRHRDVCADGFDIVGRADAVFLDLPHPWEVIKHAKNAINVTVFILLQTKIKPYWV